MDFHLAVHVLLLAGWSVGYENKYCKLCQVPGSHTMCIFPKPGPGPRCMDYKPAPLTDEEKILIVEVHNQLRNKVALGLEGIGNPGPQPPASNMRQLSWNEELAVISQRWADQCIDMMSPNQHDNCRSTDKYRGVGQNIAVTGTSGPFAEKNETKRWIMMWFEEVKDFNKNWVRLFDGDALSSLFLIGHYTQLVWGTTHLMGCGRVVYSEYKGTERWTYGRLVCNYAPAGNVQGDAVYYQGKGCSRCPNGTSCNPVYKGLCSTPEELAAASGGPSGGLKPDHHIYAMHYGIVLTFLSLFLV